MTQAQKYLPNNIQVCKHLTVQIHQQPHYPLPLACSVNIDKTVLPCPNVPSTIYVLLAHITIFYSHEQCMRVLSLQIFDDMGIFSD